LITADDISAKTFFKALENKDSSLLGIDNHEKVFIALKDQYYELRNDPFTKNDLNSHKQITKLKHKLSLLYLIKEVYQRLPLNATQRKKLEDSLEELGYNLKEKSPEQVEKFFMSWIGSIKNSIKISESKLTKKKETDDSFSFGGILVAFEHVIERSIPEDCSLSKFLAYEKEAKAIIKQHKQNKR